jgi:hypothetical protein
MLRSGMESGLNAGYRALDALLTKSRAAHGWTRLRWPVRPGRHSGGALSAQP